ncbi:hypothetical protein CR513_13070, partial [Mucuna pruriens]
MNEEMKTLERNETWEMVERLGEEAYCLHMTRLVVKGYTHTYDIDYEKMFALMSKMNIVGILLSFVVYSSLEEVYMEIPSGFRPTSGMNKVYRLRKQWCSWATSKAKKVILFSSFTKRKLIVLLVYVDDIIDIRGKLIVLQLLKEKLFTEFEMMELEKLKKNVLDLLQETCKLVSVPIGQTHIINIEKESAKVVRKLIYVAHTRSDVVYAISIVSQFMLDSNVRHLQAVDHILQYLKATGGSLTMKAYIDADADYAGLVSDRRSTRGYCTLLYENLVTWRNKKQNVLLWMEIVLDDLKIKYEDYMKLFCDNKFAISIAHNFIQYDSTQHIEID